MVPAAGLATRASSSSLLAAPTCEAARNQLTPRAARACRQRRLRRRSCAGRAAERGGRTASGMVRTPRKPMHSCTTAATAASALPGFTPLIESCSARMRVKTTSRLSAACGARRWGAAREPLRGGRSPGPHAVRLRYGARATVWELQRVLGLTLLIGAGCAARNVRGASPASRRGRLCSTTGRLHAHPLHSCRLTPCELQLCRAAPSGPFQLAPLPAEARTCPLASPVAQ
jgi:hypothetical protein